MSQALYRKYRSKKFSELKGQDHITRVLQTALKNGTVSHAYLLTGPRGTGKTSIARILAHEVNGLTYDEAVSHLDIIEIDAASNRRIDEIRDLREKVNIAPTSAKYKVYIIDEVHMLTREAFNALLKTLEEPPEHVIFILATTELHKVPETIVSRTQRFTLKPIEQAVLADQLKKIAEKEGFKVDDEALDVITEHAAGGFRDAISLLDQVSQGRQHISEDDVYESLGIPPKTALNTLWESIMNNQPAEARKSLQSLFESGYHAPLIAGRMVERAIDAENIQCAKLFMPVSHSSEPKTELLLAVLEAANTGKNSSILTKTQPEASAPANSDSLSVKPIVKTAPKPPVKQLQAAESKTPAIETPKDSASTNENADTDTFWPKVLDYLKQHESTLYGTLRMAKVRLVGDTIEMRFKFPFHLKRASDQKVQKTIIDAVKKIAGMSVDLSFSKDEGLAPLPESKPTAMQTISEQPQEAGDAIGMVRGIFGNAEVL